MGVCSSYTVVVSWYGCVFFVHCRGMSVCSSYTVVVWDVRGHGTVVVWDGRGHGTVVV